MPLDAVVFDLDGTLVDTAPDIRVHVNAVLAELGRPPLDLAAARSMIGNGAKTLLECALLATGGVPAHADLDTLLAGFLERYAAAPAEHGPIHPGVIEVLQELGSDGIALGVCTNKAQWPTDRLLEVLDLARHFGAVIGGDALPVKKPAPGHLDAVLARLGARAGRAVLVGDSETDVLAARASDVPVVLVSFGYTRVPVAQLGADRVIDHFAELPAVLSELTATPRGPGRAELTAAARGGGPTHGRRTTSS
jgi:phosphoglycolate phosphatase